jgi:hypothetical protein
MRLINLPFDDVLVTDNTIKGKRSETIMRFGAVTEEMLSNPYYGFRGSYLM